MRKILGLAAKARSGKDTAASILLAQPSVKAYALADPLKRGCQALFALTNAQAWDDTLKEIPLDAWGRSPRELFQLVGTEWMRAYDPLHWLKRADREINSQVKDPFCSTTALKQRVGDAPFVLAANAFFGLSVESWSPQNRERRDEFWGVSSNQMIELIATFAYRDFPSFDAQRNDHLRVIQNKIADENDRFSAPAFNPENQDLIIIKDIRFENEAAYIRALGGEIWHIVRSDAELVKSHPSEAGIQVAPADVVIYNNGTLADYKTSIEQAWNTLTKKQKKTARIGDKP